MPLSVSNAPFCPFSALLWDFCPLYSTYLHCFVLIPHLSGDFSPIYSIFPHYRLFFSPYKHSRCPFWDDRSIPLHSQGITCQPDLSIKPAVSSASGLYALPAACPPFCGFCRFPDNSAFLRFTFPASDEIIKAHPRGKPGGSAPEGCYRPSAQSLPPAFRCLRNAAPFASWGGIL